jgi:hypothetical protein
MEMRGEVVHRLYWDFEKEERWLNEMAAKGWQLGRYSLGTYHFEPGEAGHWIYRIELLSSAPRSPAGREYLAFLRDTGVETVSTYLNWAYLRRLAASGSFDLFSDLESRITHYRRILRLFTAVLAALVAAATACVVSAGNSGGLVLVVPLVLVATVGAGIAVQTVRLARRVRSLTVQRQVYE